MKLRSLFLALIAGVAALVACEEEKPIIGISIDKETLEIPQDGGTVSVQVVTNAEWKVTIPADAEWLSVTPRSGSGSAMVVLSAEENTGKPRKTTVKVDSGMTGSATVVVSQPGKIAAGDGKTPETAFSASEAYAWVMANISANNEASKENFYVKGFIHKIGLYKEVEQYFANNTYGNATFYMSDAAEYDPNAEKDFEAYQVFYLGNRKFDKTKDTDIKVGDEVIIYGPITKYNATAETMGQGAAFIYSLNGVVEEVQVVDYAAAEAKTVQEFIALKDPNTYYKLTGTVSNFNATYCSFDLTDATGTIYVYSVLDAYKTDEWKNKIKNGGTITIAGQYEYYESKKQDEVVNAALLDYQEAAESEPKGTGTLEDPFNGAGAIKYIKDNGDSDTKDKVYVKGKIATIKYEFNATNGTAQFVITDDGQVAGTQFTCYSVLYLGNRKWENGDAQIKIGDEVIIHGLLTCYNGLYETKSQQAYIYSLNGQTEIEQTDYFNVAATEVNVASSATEAKVTVIGNVAWTATSTAAIDKSSGQGGAEIIVTFDANTDTENVKEYTVTVKTDAAVDVKEYTVKIIQAKALPGGAAVYTIDGTAIAAAHNEAWSYTSGEKTVTATDGSVWTLFNTYSNKNQVTIQMNKGKSAYVLTPALPAGKEIKKIAVVLNTKNDGTGEIGTRPMDILSADGTATVLDDVTGQTLADGLDVASGHSQLRIICDETNGGASYITGITVIFGD